ncbi:MAG TPA: MFS transporter [Thermoleophilia bacterium]|nr:MFS transporter [Thermoleophilia bacterium]
MRRATAGLLYLAIFSGELLWSGFVPLVPQLSQRFDLSKLQSGVLLATTSATVVVVSLPAATICERVGPRRLTVLATAIIALATFWQGVAGSFLAIVGARALFGVGFGIIWISALRWLSELAGSREAQALSLTVTTAGVSSVVGPTVSGVVVTRFGMAGPFTVIAAVNALLAVAMCLEPTRSGRSTSEEQPIREILAGAVADRLVTVSLLVMAIAGLFSAAINLLVPLRLHENGVSTSWIGIAFGASALVFIAASGGVARAVDRLVNIRAVAYAMAVVVVVTLIPLASESTPALIGYLLARAPLTAFMFTVAFPLGAIGARKAGITVGAVAALINVAWSMATLIGPLIFAVVAQQAGYRGSYVVLIVLFAAAIAWVLLPPRAAPATAPSEGG